MEIFGGLVDFKTTVDGDLVIENNDIAKTSGINWFIQEVNKILKSSSDWYFAPNAGAALDRFYGSVNSRAIAAQIQDMITSKITRQGIHVPGDINVRVVPLSRDEIKIYITLIIGHEIIPVNSVIFDMQKGNMKDTEAIAQQQDTTTPIKHPFAARFL